MTIVPIARGIEPAQPPPPTVDQLVGAWRLVNIEFSRDGKRIPDPFYQAGSTGLIVYDRAGWMSVQIMAPHREPLGVAATRPVAEIDHEGHRKASAFDTYYAYFGTWDYDAARSVMTHHVKGSLTPGETGQDYEQAIRLDAGRLIFTGHGEDRGRSTIRTKIWERVDVPSG